MAIRLRDSTIHLIGSIHSTDSCVSRLTQLKPTHLLVEATRDIVGLIKRNRGYSTALKDLPSVVAYSIEQRIPLHCLDTTASDLTHRVFGDLSARQKLDLWLYVLGRKMFVPGLTRCFQRTVSRGGVLDFLTYKWLLSPSLLRECRELLQSGGTEEDVAQLISSRQDVSTFECSANYDPLAYQRLCASTQIDTRLQSSVIDYRNDFMCNELRRLVRSIPPESVCAVVVGENHVKGMHSNLSKGMDFNPLPAKVPPKESPFSDQLLLAQLLNT